MDQVKSPRPFRMFRIELRRLARLYDGCLFAFSRTKEDLRDERVSPSAMVSLTAAPKIGNLDWRSHELAKAMETSFPATLRETLLVRIVSQTESYLVDIVRDIASRDLGPFRNRHKEIKLSQAEALSFTSIEQFQRKIIDSECRSLGGKNFDDLKKYFKKTLALDFGPSPSVVSRVGEIYARRHLFVHAGGIVDRHYAHAFDQTLHPGERLQVPEDYLLRAIEAVSELAGNIAEQVSVRYPGSGNIGAIRSLPEILNTFESRIFDSANARPKVPLVLHWVLAEFRTVDLVEHHIAPDSSFTHNDDSFRVQDIMVGSVRRSDTVMEFLLMGTKEEIGSYVAFLTYLERQGTITHLEKLRLKKKNFLLGAQWSRFAEQSKKPTIASAGRDSG